MDGALAGVFDTVVDPEVGIIGALDEIPLALDAPGYVHYRARLCDPSVLGGVATSRVVETTATHPGAAANAAVLAGVSRYCAALYDRAALPLATIADAPFDCLGPDGFALFARQQYETPGFPYVPFEDDTPVKWSSAVDLASGETVHVPAAMVWHPFAYERTAGDLPVAVASPVGLGCGAAVTDAVLAGLADLVACDAAALFWQAMIQPPRLNLATLPRRFADQVAAFVLAGDTVTAFDVTTDNRIPAFVAVAGSGRRDRPARIFAVAADLDAAIALEKVLCRLAGNRRRAEAVMRNTVFPGPGNDWEDVLAAEDHVGFAADHGNDDWFAWLAPEDEWRDLSGYDSESTGDDDGDLEIVLGRIMNTGHRVYAANLTSEDVAGLGLTVCRAIVPGYQPLVAGHHLRALGGDRLYDAPRKLGHRGITREGGGNPAPHPFP